MRLAANANALSCARTSKTFVDDERHFRGGEVIGVEADAAIIESALADARRVAGVFRLADTRRIAGVF